MIQPPTVEQLAELWWKGLAPGEQELWEEEAGSKDPVAMWQLYWSRGPMLSERDVDRLTLGMCPICARRGFVIGPIGGMNVNIECAQLDCRSRFNVAFFSGQAVMGHHLPNGATAEPWPSEPRWLG